MSQPFHEQVRLARLKRHLNQAKLGKKVGCTQPLISRFEGGDPTALSPEICAALAEELGLPEFQTSTGLAASGRTLPEHLEFCPNHDCPIALTSVIGGRIAVRPIMYRLRGNAPAHCKDCGTLLETGCSSCLTPLVDGASFCAGCGEALVSVPASIRKADPEEHSEMMGKRLALYLETRAATEALPAARLQNSQRKKRPSSK